MDEALAENLKRFLHTRRPRMSFRNEVQPLIIKAIYRKDRAELNEIRKELYDVQQYVGGPFRDRIMFWHDAVGLAMDHIRKHDSD